MIGAAVLGPAGAHVWAGWSGRTRAHDALALVHFAAEYTPVATEVAQLRFSVTTAPAAADSEAELQA